MGVPIPFLPKKRKRTKNLSKNLNDICSMIMQKDNNTSNLKLQKLLYIVQAVSLCVKGESAFEEEIFAWQYGPTVPFAYYAYKKDKSKFLKTDISEFKKSKLGRLTNGTICNFMKKNSFYLVDMTMQYSSWKNAWKHGPDGLITCFEIADCHNEWANRNNNYLF